MAMDEKMFANYAEQLEKEDFEDEVCPEETNRSIKFLRSGARAFQQHQAVGGCPAGDDCKAASQR